MRVRGAFVAAMLVSTGLLAGCSESLEAELIVESVPPADASEGVLLAWGQRVLEGQCMVEAGFRFTVTYTANPLEDIDPMVQLYGRTDLAWVEEYGYGIHQSPEIPEPVDRNAEYTETLSGADREKFWTSYSGDPEANEAVEFVDIQGNPGTASQGGCQRSAQDELYSDYEQWVMASGLLDNHDGVAYQAVQADPDYQVGVALWSDCMAKSGYEVLDQSSALGMAASGSSGEEIALAVADAQCLIDTGLFDLGVELHEREVSEFKARYSDEWGVYEELRNDGLAKATQLRNEYSTG